MVSLATSAPTHRKAQPLPTKRPRPTKTMKSNCSTKAFRSDLPAARRCLAVSRAVCHDILYFLREFSPTQNRSNRNWSVRTSWFRVYLSDFHSISPVWSQFCQRTGSKRTRIITLWHKTLGPCAAAVAWRQRSIAHCRCGNFHLASRRLAKKCGPQRLASP